ncbi:MAG: DUF5666 domain-containing protein [Steroidobacteraceae bacterium]
MKRMLRFTRRPACWLQLLMTALLAACGGKDLHVGIDGTGSKSPPLPIVSIGRVRSFGSVEVNGVHYDTAAANVLIDGSAASVTDLRLGDVLYVEGTLDASGGRGNATRVQSDHLVQGRVQSIDLAAQRFTVLGQNIIIGNDTLFDATVASLAGLAVNDAVEISGFITAEGSVAATRVDRQAAGSDRIKLIGTVTASDPATHRLEINGLSVDYSGAVLLPAGPLPAIARGDSVELQGTLDPAQQLAATRVRIRGKRLQTSANSQASIEGYLTAVDPTDHKQLEVGGLQVTTSSATAFTGTPTPDALLSVRGTVDAGGAVVANDMKSSFVTPPAPPTDIRIQAFDAVQGPLAGVPANLWINLAGGNGYSYTWATGRTPATGADGSVTVSVPLGSTVSVWANAPGFVQPCAAQATVHAPLSIDVELVSVSRLDNPLPPPPQSAAPPVLTGLVYELTADGQQRPVPGALITVSSYLDLVDATTVTDAGGHYLLCRLHGAPHDSHIELHVQKAGYAAAGLWPVDPQAGVRDVELQRLP